MASKQASVALLVLATGLVIGCSKTADTTPERRLFGTPPTIESVTFTPATVHATCDYSDYARFSFCAEDPSAPPFTLDGVGMMITANYSDLTMTVKVTDPDSGPSGSDILLVGASYKLPENNVENTIVLFDDGSKNSFPGSADGQINRTCTVDEDAGTCECVQPPKGNRSLLSGDTTAGDETFTRRFAFFGFKSGIKNQENAFFDCIQRAEHEAPFTFSGDPHFQFRIDVTDKSGNLTTWPDRPQFDATTGTFACSGDRCACCIFFETTTPSPDCRGLPGMIGPPGSPYESGVCMTL